MKKCYLSFALLLAVVAWSCSKLEQKQSFTLRQSVESNVAKINSALDDISVTKGYQLLTTGEVSKAEFSFSDSITLELVAGIYDYQPVPFRHKHYFLIPYRLFKKTGTSDKMIVNLPEKHAFHPKYLRGYNPADTVLVNNFTITASDYHLYFTPWNGYDYKLTAGLTLDSANIGEIDMVNAIGSEGIFLSADFTFAEGYAINVTRQSGDTSISAFALSDDEGVLLKEQVLFIKNESKKRERQYILSIGNVDIKRGSELDSIQVYLDGVLQQKAAAKIVDTSDTHGSICRHRDILLTFDDGTTANLSELIKPARETLRTLVDSLGEMYFAKNIVDYIAVHVYFVSR
jgi:hypothetical protein